MVDAVKVVNKGLGKEKFKRSSYELKNRILNTLRPIKFSSSRAARIVMARINIFIRREFP